MPLYLGLDADAHGLNAVAIEIAAERRVVFSRSVSFDRDLPEYGTTGGLRRTAEGDAAPPPLIWADALDRLLGRLAAAAEIDVEDIRAVSGASPEHTSLAFDYRADSAPAGLEPSVALARQLKPNVGPSGPVGAYLETLLVGTDGRLAPYWQKRYALPNAAMVGWTDDHAARMLGLGLINEGAIGVVFGTSDVVSAGRRVVTFRNGALARDWVRREYGLDWDAIGRLLEEAPGNDGCVMLPWVELETTPRIRHAGVRRFGFDRHDIARNVRGLIEGQVLAMANHLRLSSDRAVEKVVATGDAAAQRGILQLLANVFGAEVLRLEVEHRAALGAALRAFHADRLAAGEPLSWTSVVGGFTDPKPGHRVSPNPRQVATYAELRRDYALLERLHQDRRAIC